MLNRKIFASLYTAALEQRATALANPLLRPWHADRALPPVIGFGLPQDETVPVPMVTVGLNPSGEEYPNHIPSDDGEELQWKAQTRYFHASPYRR